MAHNITGAAAKKLSGIILLFLIGSNLAQKKTTSLLLVAECHEAARSIFDCVYYNYRVSGQKSKYLEEFFGTTKA